MTFGRILRKNKGEFPQKKANLLKLGIKTLLFSVLIPNFVYKVMSFGRRGPVRVGEISFFGD